MTWNQINFSGAHVFNSARHLLCIALLGLSFAGTFSARANVSPVITSNGGGTTANVSLPENTTAVTTVTATDADVGQTLTYSISGGVDAARFTINPTTGVLGFSGAPNFEVPTDANLDNVYVVTVQVSDGNGGTVTQTLSVAVTNVNEAPAITSNGGGASANISIPENTTAVTSVSATDPEGTAVSYSINGGADAAKFTINGTTGVLTFIGAPNFEVPTDANADNVYVVVVRAADPLGNASTQTLSVSVSNVNEPPVITSNGGGATAGISIPENTTAVTTVTATDDDAGQALTYSISGGADAVKFAINPKTGSLSFIGAPNFEVPTDANLDNVYVVTVQVSDGNGGTDTQTLSVTVTNANEAPVITSNGGGASANISIPEHTTTVTSVNATDPEGTAVTYSINGGADAAKFTINATTGALSFIGAPNFEVPTDANGDNVYVVVVRAADPLGNANTQTLNVSVTNVNEPPAITSNGGGVTASVSVPENTTAVTSVTATDPDVAQTLTYSINGGADAGKFTVNATTGALSFSIATSFQAPTDANGDNVYVVTVQVSDGNGGTDTQTLSVTVTKADEKLIINRIAADAYELKMAGANGVSYALEFSPTLALSNQWSSLVTNSAGVDGFLRITNFALTPAGFYRTRRVP